jgi:hypothetical protein
MGIRAYLRLLTDLAESLRESWNGISEARKKKTIRWLKGILCALIIGVIASLIAAEILNSLRSRRCFEVTAPQPNTVLVAGQTKVFEFDRACETDKDHRWLLFIAEDGRWYYSIPISCKKFEMLRVFVPLNMNTIKVHATIIACEGETLISGYLTRARQGALIPSKLLEDGFRGNECEQFEVGDYNILLADGSTPVLLPTPTPGVSVPLKTSYSFPQGRRSLRNNDLIQGETGGPVARTWLALECQGKLYPTARLSSVGSWSHSMYVPPELVGKTANIVILQVSAADDRRLSLADREAPDGVTLVDGFTYVQRDAEVELRRE